MKSIVENQIEKFNAQHRTRQRLLGVLLLLALVVATGVFWQLRSTGVAITNQVYCGQEEHTHSEACLGQVLTCEVEEGDAHTHDAGCVEEQLLCGQEEHTHSVACLSDITADVETAEDWEATLPELTGDFAEDVVAVAQSQLDYAESTANFTLAEDGETRQGYTRYGAWYGSEYGDWDSLFAAFCLYYAGAAEETITNASGAYAWYVALTELELVEEDALPEPGALVFFDTDEDETADQVGIVTALTEETLTVIAGDVDDAVAEWECSLDEETIFAYVMLPSAAELADEADEAGMTLDDENKVLEGEAVFTADLENYTLTVYLSGSVELSQEVDAEESVLSEEGELVMTAEILEESDEDYAQLAAYTEENASGEMVDFTAIALTFSYDDQELDVSDCALTVEITPTETLLSAALSEDDEEEQAVTLAVLSLEEDEVDELETLALTLSDETPMLTVSLSSATVLAVSATELANPSFTVQYYAYLDIVNTSGDVTLSLIDTSGANLPKNNSTLTTTTMGINLVSGTAGSVGAAYEVSTTSTLTEVYSSETYTYAKAPGISYINKVASNTHYSLKEIWVTDNATVASTTSSSGWTVYSTTSVSFTNNSAITDSDTIVITDNTVIRLVYDTTTGTFSGLGNFYDYDISDGVWYTSSSTSGGTTTSQTNTQALYLYTVQQGINSSSNYSGSGTKLAFGNINTQTGMGGYTWSNNGQGNYLNMYNYYNSNEFGCTFSLVTALIDGKIQYGDGVDAPNLFDDGDAVGKTTYNSQTMTFVQDGDTYTFSSVSGSGANQTDLDKLYITYSSGSTKLYSNNFFPLDSAASYGTSGHDLKFGSSTLKAYRYAFGVSDVYQIYSSGSWKQYTKEASGQLPPSDDNADHNSYFGMQYAISFDLTEDYIGPLEYYFYGDDDMWVFLDGQLVCDIGGVHSSVGEYVNLWDYIEKGTSGTHTLSFYFTERGASGSSCWMRFTLPSITSVTPVQNTGSLRVEKEVQGTAEEEDAEYTFKITLTDSSGKTSNDLYGYSSTYNAAGNQTSTSIGTVKSGDTFTLSNGDYIIISNLPEGTICTVEETTTGFTTTYTVDSATAQSGTTATTSITSGNVTVIHFTNAGNYVLPSAGGEGTQRFTLIGLLLSSTAAYLLYKKKRRRKEVLEK